MSTRWSLIGLLFTVGSMGPGLVACAAGNGGSGGTGGESGQGGATAQGSTAGATVGSTSGGVIVGSSTSAAASTSTSAASSTASGGVDSCDVLAADSCGDCIESMCCADLVACKKDAACWDCLTGAGTSGCSTNAAFTKTATCAVNSCGPVLVPDPNMETGPHIESNPCHLAPPGWTCDPALYDQAYKTPGGPVVCNCTCGGFRDPDCLGNAPSDCAAGLSCGGPICGCVPPGVGCQ